MDLGETVGKFLFSATFPNKNKKQNDSIARSKDIPSSTHLPGNGAGKELDVYYTTFFL